MDKEFARESTYELIRELCRLIDRGIVMTRDQFHELCDQERFVDFLFVQHKEGLRLEYLDEQSTLCKADVLEYINNAFGRHANVVVMEDFGLKNNALLLALNTCVAILRELDDVR